MLAQEVFQRGGKRAAGKQRFAVEREYEADSTQQLAALTLLLEAPASHESVFGHYWILVADHVYVIEAKVVEHLGAGEGGAARSN